jgi:hypothetical protein
MTIRIAAQVWESLQAAAEANGQNFSDWARATLLRAAADSRQESQSIAL